MRKHEVRVYKYPVLVCGLLLVLILSACVVPSVIPSPAQEPEAAPETLEPLSEPTSETELSPESPTLASPVSEPQPKSLPTPTHVPAPQPEPCCPCGTPPAESIQYPTAQTAFWHRIPSIVVAAKPSDPRIQLTKDAVAFWNRQLSEIGTPFRFGAITRRIKMLPADYLEQMSATVGQQNRPPPHPQLADISENIIIALSDGNFTSFSSILAPEKRLAGITNCNISPLNLKNVQRNLIAHELGHTLGLGHNNDPTKLMWWRPATCRLDRYHCEIEKYFPLTHWEKAHILRLYPATWTAR